MHALQPGAWFPAFSGGHWLGVKSACQLRQESFPGTDPSQQAGEEGIDNPLPLPQQLPELKASAPLLLVWLLPQDHSPSHPEIGRVCGLAHFGWRYGWEGLNLLRA